MKNFLLIAIFVISVTAGYSQSSAADRCSYCPEIETLKAGFAKLKPDPMNEETIDAQLELVDKTMNLVGRILKQNKDLPLADLERMISIMAIAAPFDAQHLIPEENMPLLKPHLERFYKEVDRMKKKGQLTEAQAERLIIAVAIVEDETEQGNDPDAGKAAPAPNKETKKKKPAKR